MLPIHISDSAATSQDGSSLEFVTANMGRKCFIQNARCGGLCPGRAILKELIIRITLSAGAILSSTLVVKLDIYGRIMPS